MTGFEFAKLLGELPEEYVQQAQVYRTGSHRAMPTGSRGKRALGILAAAVLAIAMLGGFYWVLNHLARREAVEQSPVNTWQNSILRGDETFWSETYQKPLTLEEYTSMVQQTQNNTACTPWAYTALDMDRDGRRELAVRFRSGQEDILTLILWKEQDGIIGREYTKQQMYFLKKDGTFYYVSENHWGWGQLEQQGNDYVPVIRIPQGGSYSIQEDASWMPLSGEVIPAQTRNSCAYLGLSGKNGVSGEIYGALTETEDYSLYVPISGWSYTQTSPYATVENADSWYCTEVPEARLTVFKTDSDATTWQKPGYVFQRASFYTLEMRKDTSVLHVYVRLGETTNYVLELEYPEDFWDTDILKRMLDSIRFTHSVSANREPEWTIGLDNAMLDAILFVDARYSLYIPTEWDTTEPVAETIGAYTANSWYGPEEEVLSVVELGPTEDAESWAIQALNLDSSQVQEDDSILGNAGDTQIAISFRQDGLNRTFAIIRRCPAPKAAESLPILNALAENLMFSSEN